MDVIPAIDVEGRPLAGRLLARRRRRHRRAHRPAGPDRRAVRGPGRAGSSTSWTSTARSGGAPGQPRGRGRGRGAGRRPAPARRRPRGGGPRPARLRRRRHPRRRCRVAIVERPRRPARVPRRRRRLARRGPGPAARAARRVSLAARPMPPTLDTLVEELVAAGRPPPGAEPRRRVARIPGSSPPSSAATTWTCSSRAASRDLDGIRRLRDAGVAGLILGEALLSGAIDLPARPGGRRMTRHRRSPAPRRLPSPSCSPLLDRGGGALRRSRRHARDPGRVRAPRRGPPRTRLPRRLPHRPARRARRRRDPDGHHHDRQGRHRDQGRGGPVAHRGRQLRRARGVRLLRRRRVPPRSSRASSSRAATASSAASRTSIPGHVGTGGPPYTIKDEPVTATYGRGTVAMARTPQPDRVGSQFFIVLDDAAATPRRGTTRTRSSARSRPAWTWSTRSRRCRTARTRPTRRSDRRRHDHSVTVANP